MDVRQARTYFESRCKQAIYEFEGGEEQALAELQEALAVFDALVRAAHHDRP